MAYDFEEIIVGLEVTGCWVKKELTEKGFKVLL